MTGVYQVPDILQESDWAVKIDLKHGKISYLDIKTVDGNMS